MKPAILFYDSRRSFRTYFPDELAKSDGMPAMGHTQGTTFGRYNVEPQRAALRVLNALENTKPRPSRLPITLLGSMKAFQAGALTEPLYQAARANLPGITLPAK